MKTRKDAFTPAEIAAMREARGEVEEVTIGNRTLRKGDVITVYRASGDFTFFSAHVHDGEVTSICVFGGTKGYQKWRHFLPERVKSKKRASALVAKGLL